MNSLVLDLFAKLQSLKNEEDGQDLVEYALLVALDLAGWSPPSKTLALQSTAYSWPSALHWRRASRR